MIQRTACLHLP